MRHGWILALVMGLCGCTQTGAPPAHVSSSAAVLGGSLILTAPEGYCVDPSSRQQGADAVFVLWGNCAAIARDPLMRQPRHRALLSATVGPVSRTPIRTALTRYESFIRSEAGRAALARSGRAEDLKILEIRRSPSALLLKIADHSAPQNAPVEPVYWRAITGVSGHVTALSVMPLTASGIGDATQIGLLQAFEKSIRTSN